MDNKYSKRDYLLPKGCKDLSDLFRYFAAEGCNVLIEVPKSKAVKSTPKTQVSKPCGELVIPEQTSVQQLAVLVGRHPSRIIVDALEIGVYSCVTTILAFSTISKIAHKYGYRATQAVT